MFLTVHATVAAALTQSIPNPWVAFVIGFFSHFVLDAIPHGDEIIGTSPTKKGRLIRLLTAGTIDGIILSVLLFALFFRGILDPSLPIIFAMIGAMLPDALQILPDFFNSPPLQRLQYIHHAFHAGIEPPPFARLRPHYALGITLQIITLALALKIISG